MEFFYPGIDNPPVLEKFDWAAHGIKHKFIILMTGRTGSTLLGKLIEGTGLVGTARECFNLRAKAVAQIEKRTDNRIADLLTELAKNEARNGYFGTQIDVLRLRAYSKILNFETVFPKNETQYIWLYRRDLASQGHSYAAARKTGIWHAHRDAGGRIPPTGDLGISDADVWQDIVSILANERSARAYFNQLGVTPLSLTYEDLVAAPQIVLARALDHIGIAPKDYLAKLEIDEMPTSKLAVGSKLPFIARFHARYVDLLADINSNRKRVDLNDLCQQLGNAGIDVSPTGKVKRTSP